MAARGQATSIRIGDGRSKFRTIFMNYMEDFGSKCYVQVKCSHYNGRERRQWT